MQRMANVGRSPCEQHADEEFGFDEVERGTQIMRVAPRVGELQPPEVEPRASLAHSAPDSAEEEFWNEQPRYSLEAVFSLPPAPLKAPPSPLRRSGAKLLVALICAALSLLLALETWALVRASHAQPGRTRVALGRPG